MSRDRILMATESQPPPDLGAQASIRRTRNHQTRVAELVRQHGGEILVHVGQGCVASLPDPESALAVVTALLVGRSSARDIAQRVRVAMHRGPLDPAATVIAEPTVARTRELLELAAPTEVVVSATLWETIEASPTQATPVPVWDASADDTPTAYRLLLNPLAAAEDSARRPIPVWHIAGAVALSSVAVLTAIVVALLL